LSRRSNKSCIFSDSTRQVIFGDEPPTVITAHVTVTNRVVKGVVHRLQHTNVSPAPHNDDTCLSCGGNGHVTKYSATNRRCSPSPSPATTVAVADMCLAIPLTHADMQRENKGTGTGRRRVALKAAAMTQPVSSMLSMIGATLNVSSVHTVMVRGGHAPVTACTAGREITPHTGTTMVKIVTTITRNKQELADKTLDRAMLLAKAHVHTLTLRRLKCGRLAKRSRHRQTK